MYIRKLTIEDGESLWNLRLRALKDNPEAFAATYEETPKNASISYSTFKIIWLLHGSSTRIRSSSSSKTTP